MRTLADACRPRPSVFDGTARDAVHDLADLLDGRIEARGFFEESHPTEGQRLLVEQAFRRFAGMDAHSVFHLSQSMGGGKTHSMIALGLLARHPELRAAHGGDAATTNVGRVRLVGFTGRDSDAPLGIWGALASQLGKKELFEGHYAPLSAPGPTAWIELLRGDPVLVLLDELPPYFHAARAREIGHSDLAEITTTALANLFVAVQRRELENVVVVVSDLDGRNYGAGHDHMLAALENLRDETGRAALNIQPVRPNNDELYSILRRRLFAELPTEDEIDVVARGFQKAMKAAKEMSLVSDSAEAFAEQVRDAYPFHPSLRDLYARFKENPGFQQTRGILRLMRALVARLFGAGGRAKERYLVAPFDLDLNDRETLAQIQVIHPAVTNAITHDVASGGTAVAEQIDRRRGGTDALDAATQLLVASLSNVPHATLGLTETELVRDLLAPGRDIRAIPREVVSALGGEAWYLHQGAQGRLFFKNTENVVAKLRTYARGYAPEVVLTELRRRLSDGFAPRLGDCYQRLSVLPALDEVETKNDQVLLVVLRPGASGGLPPDVTEFWTAQDDKNRVAFLSGDRDVMETMLDLAAQGKAIDAILEELAASVPEHDPQRQEAVRQRERLAVRLRSAVREGFTALYFPSVAENRQGQKSPQLRRADLNLEFEGNDWSGEATIRRTLKDKGKFAEDATGDVFRRKIEERLFTQKEMQWATLRHRAGTLCDWQWHHTSALDRAKKDAVERGQWRENGDWVEKGPFAPPRTDVRVKQVARDDGSGAVTLNLQAVHGDAVHYEIGAPATPASARLEHLSGFVTDELELSFLCIDSTGQHETGPPASFRNTITMKHAVTPVAAERARVELRAVPDRGVRIRYTTEGSDPAVSGAAYEGPFEVRPPTSLVLAIASRGTLSSERIQVPVSWTGRIEVDPTKPAVWRRRHDLSGTRASFDFLARLRKFRGRAGAFVTTVTATAGSGQVWAETSLASGVEIDAEAAESAVRALRPIVGGDETVVDARCDRVRFETGQDLLDWVTEAHVELAPGEVEQ